MDTPLTVPDSLAYSFLQPYALQTWVLHHLHQGLGQWAAIAIHPPKTSGAIGPLSTAVQSLAQLPLGQLPLGRSYHPPQLSYHSALARRLQAHAPHAPALLLPHLAPQWPASAWAILPPSALVLEAGVSPWGVSVAAGRGWVWDLSGAALAHWLQGWLQCPPTPLSQSSSPPTSPWDPADPCLWQAQLAHGRCCQLLTLAQGLGWVTLAEAPSAGGHPLPRLASPHRIPWLTAHSPDSMLHLEHPSQWLLLDRALGLVDALAWKPGRSAPLLPQFLAALDQFQRHHPLAALHQSHPPETLDRCLGLIQLSQSLLRVVLEDISGAIAPADL